VNGAKKTFYQRQQVCIVTFTYNLIRCSGSSISITRVGYGGLGGIKTLKSLEYDRDQDLLHKTKTHVYETKTSVYVLEEPRKQDYSFEDYNTATY